MADNKEDTKKPQKVKEEATKPVEEKVVEEVVEDKPVEAPATVEKTESVEEVSEEAPASEEVVVEETPAEVAKTPTDFNVGDTIIVNYKIIEGEKHRIQPFEGIVIAKRGNNISKSFTVRRMAAGNIGVERIFQAYSPNIDSIKIRTRGKVRRAKLYYLRKRVGKAATKVKEKV